MTHFVNQLDDHQLQDVVERRHLGTRGEVVVGWGDKVWEVAWKVAWKVARKVAREAVVGESGFIYRRG